MTADPTTPIGHLVTFFSWKDAIWEFALGVSVGSFLNVLALRTLAERNVIWPPSSCMHCDKRLGIFDLIPIASYMLLKGRCRYCKQRISWQYPFVELVTGIMFVVVLQSFGLDFGVPYHPGVLNPSAFSFQGWAMVVFVSILIVLCITDFREKLLPHEITYPSMLLGISYSAFTRPDGLMNCLAGVGISYIVFDFLAFYGLILYRWSHKEADGAEEGLEEETEQEEPQQAGHQSVESEPWWQMMFRPANEIAEQNQLSKKGKRSAAATLATAQISSPQKSNHCTPLTDANVAPVTDTDIAATVVPEQDPVVAPIDSREIDSLLISGSGPIKFSSRLRQQTETKKNGDSSSDLEFDPFIDQTFNVNGEEPNQDLDDESDEDFEVMGGGDAVLAAVIAAWLGLSGLGFTLLGGFLLGTCMGAGYLLHEMHLHGSLNSALKKIALWCGILLLLFEGVWISLGRLYASGGTQFIYDPSQPLIIAALAIFFGSLLGIIATGRKYSKPFPFGPALAVAATASIFWNNVVTSSGGMR